MSDFKQQCEELVKQAQQQHFEFTNQAIKQLLDHTCLNRNAALDDLIAATPLLSNVAAVCVYPENIQMIKEMAPQIPIATVLNFPDGNQHLKEILKDCEFAMQAGAAEFDMVLPYRLYLQGNPTQALAPIHSVRHLLGPEKKLKIILETGAFDDLDQIKQASKDCIAAGGDFIKTSTGKISYGASPLAVAAILLSLKTLNRPMLGCKVSGGIRDLSDIQPYLNMACIVFGQSWVEKSHFRIGASKILQTLSS